MKNKQVKKMICRILDKRHGSYVPYFGFFFDENGLNHAYPGGFGPDNYHDECELFKQGVKSLTADQLKEVKR